MENVNVKRKVCVFCEKWESGGIESFLRNVLCHMNLSAMEIDIVSAELAESVFTRELERLGIRFIELSGNQRKMRKNCRAFSRILHERKYDVAHINLFQGLSLSYVRLARQAGIPIRIVHSHNTALRKSSTRWLKLLIHNVAKKVRAGEATEFWACSKSAAEFLFPEDLLAERGYRFIPNGIETERFRFDSVVRETVRRNLGVTNRFVIGNIGRLCYQKNQSFLMDVFTQVLRLRPESCLLLIGEGEELDSLRKKAKLLGISGAVIFYGTSNHVEELLCAMDAFAFPSRFEGLGIVAIEAQAAGLPTICSENVPEEAAVTELFSQCSLDSGTAGWVNAIMNSDVSMPREKAADHVKAAGYEIQYVAKEIEGKYAGEYA